MWEGRGYDAYSMIYQTTYGGRRYKQKLKWQLLLVHLYFVWSQFQTKRARFSLVFLTYVQFCSQIIFRFLVSFFWPKYLSHLEKSAHIISGSLSTVFLFTYNRSTSRINRSFNIRKKNLNFRISFEQLSYLLVSIRSKWNNNIFIVEWSYIGRWLNVGNKVWLLCDIMHFFLFNWSMYRNKNVFFLHLIRLYVNSRTIVPPKYDIIIYGIYPSYSDLPLITNKNVSHKNWNTEGYLHIFSYQTIVWLN